MGWKAAEADVGGDEVGEDLFSVGEVLTVAEIVGGLESELTAVEVAVGEVVGPEIIQILGMVSIVCWRDKQHPRRHKNVHRDGLLGRYATGLIIIKA